MDTRTKIVSAEKAAELSGKLRAEGSAVHLVIGFFDVLQPDMVAALSACTGPGARLFALIVDPSRALLSAPARAELAAALRVIDYVIPFSGDRAALLESLAPAACYEEETAHRLSTEKLIEHVFERHGRALVREFGH